MPKLDDELKALGRGLTPDVDTDATLNAVRQRATGPKPNARLRHVGLVVAIGLIAIAGIAPLSLAFRGAHRAPAASATPSRNVPFSFQGTLAFFANPINASFTSAYATSLYTVTGSDAPVRVQLHHGSGLPYADHFVGGISWSPDGSRVVAIAWEPDDYTKHGSGPLNTLVIIDMATGRETYLTTTFGAVSAVWSPAGDQIALAVCGGIGSGVYLVQPDGSGIRKLAGRITDCDVGVTWSPDGSRIGFTAADVLRSNDNIYVMAADGSGLRRIGRGTGGIQEISWSPDGKTLAYTDFNSSTSHIYLIGADGSDPRLVASGATSPNWSPDGTALAVVGGGNKVLILDQSGHQIGTLNNIAGLHLDHGIAWSPIVPPTTTATPTAPPTSYTFPGTIAMVGGSRRGDLSAVLYTVTGSGQPRLVAKFPGGCVRSPSFSPDGSQLVAIACRWRGRPGDFLVVVDMRTGHLTWLTNVPAEAYYAAWSPLGNEIAVSNSYGIFLIRPDGGGFKRLTHTGRNAQCYDDSGVTWSPDGSQIAFARTDCSLLSASRDDSGIYVMNADGSGLHMVFHSDSTQGGLGEIAWSPDSKTLAFDYTGSVYLMSQDGTGIRPLVVGEQTPTWSPDGGAIAVIQSFLGVRRGGVMIVDLSGRQLEEVRVPPGTTVVGLKWSPHS